MSHVINKNASRININLFNQRFTFEVFLGIMKYLKVHNILKVNYPI